ncbi:hypothetical protein CL619_03070 [archaeon]|nr:hypothetical protein [archaeon]|tara:strand:+ start:506 stop:1408 length:903 start_codon:yes stop_codon:yes gene_type:complete
MITSNQGNNLQDGLIDRFKRSWDVTKQTFKIMMHDKEILAFPILAAFFSIIAFIALVAPIFVTAFVTGTLGSDATPLLVYLGIFVFYFVTAFFSVFFNAGVVHIAKTRMEGGDATFMDGIKAATSKLGKLIQWSLLTATVGLILSALESQARKKGGIIGMLGKIATSLLGLAWAIVSTFVVPAIILKDQGPIDALKSSTAAIKKTWGESLIKWFGLSTVKNAIMFLATILFLLPGILSFGISISLAVFLVGLWILVLMLVSVVFRAADMIFDTALFLYADTGKEPKMFTGGVIKNAFHKK